jgi:hypothetical protein
MLRVQWRAVTIACGATKVPLQKVSSTPTSGK